MELIEIGIVRHNFSDDYVRDHMGEFSGVIEIFDTYSDGLSDLEKYKHAFVISIMHKKLNEVQPLKIKPRLLLRKGYKLEDLPEIGVFATDSPSRPNPIALTLVRIEKIEGNRIYAYGLDVFDGTPVADIKPYIGSYKAKSSDKNDESDEHCPEI